MMPLTLSRRALLGAGLAALAAPKAQAKWREITWDDLIPPGVPYAEIVGEGELDMENDTWAPIFDENATKLNLSLDGQDVRLPGYILPMEFTSDGVTDFILVPYVGACIHVPPPPPNQLVFVTTETPWATDALWDPVWVHGPLRASLQTTDIADIGYEISAERIEVYQW